jgi:hypothetical protein
LYSFVLPTTNFSAHTVFKLTRLNSPAVGCISLTPHY